MTVSGGPVRLFRNEGGNKNHWIRLNLQGRDSNRDALGAKVTLKAGGIAKRRQLFPAKSYLSSVEKTLTFGLGKEARGRFGPDRLAVGQDDRIEGHEGG